MKTLLVIEDGKQLMWVETDIEKIARIYDKCMLTIINAYQQKIFDLPTAMAHRDCLYLWTKKRITTF